MDRPEYHSTDRLKERGAEKGSGRHFILRGRERSVLSRQTLALFRGQPWGDKWERPGGARMGLSERYDAILSWNWNRNWNRTTALSSAKPESPAGRRSIAVQSGHVLIRYKEGRKNTNACVLLRSSVLNWARTQSAHFSYHPPLILLTNQNPISTHDWKLLVQGSQPFQMKLLFTPIEI